MSNASVFSQLFKINELPKVFQCIVFCILSVSLFFDVKLIGSPCLVTVETRMQHLFLSCKMKNQGCKKNLFLREKYIDLLANSHFTRISKFGTGAELFINFFTFNFGVKTFPRYS